MKDKIKNIETDVLQKIMDRAIIIDKNCNAHCRDFKIMESDQYPDTLILGWTSIDLDNHTHPAQCYHYQCFTMDGISQNCGIHYSDQSSANAFFESLKTLYTQSFAIDHKLKNYV